MADLRKHSSTSNIIRLVLKHATTGVGLTGLTSTSTGLIISTIADNEATATAYTVTGSTIETITTLGTFATPTATKCRFKEVDATNHKGLYEFQFADARFSVASAKRLIVSVTGATNLLDADYEIQLVQFDPYDSVRMGLTALDVAVSTRLASASYTTPPTAVENADALLGRNVSGGSSTGRTVKQAFHFLRNKWTLSGGVLTVYDTDDTTSSWTGASTQTAGDPVSSIDPA